MSSGTVTATPAGVTPAPGTRRRPLLRRPPRLDWPTSALLLICYVPLLFTQPGKIGADTKQYLYLDPDRMLSRAPYMWDPHVGMGTVTHQNIGYLLPMGPWYWFFSHIGVPTWVAQRLWTGTLLFAAATGVMYLLRTFGWSRRAMFVAGLAYGLTPYVLEYEARISAILMPWAGLGWLLGTVIRGLRVASAAADDPAHPPGRLTRWRHPAIFALIVALVGAVNATSLIYVLIAPILWLPFAIWGWHEVRLRTVLAFAGRTILLTFLANLWWMSGLYTQAGWGLDVLAYTETVKTVASSSQASEVLRGLGNWYFYGRDGIAAWVEPANAYTGNLLLMAISFAVPTLALLSAACIRWGYRAYFVMLIFVGTAISVGVYPYKDPSPLGGLFKAFAASSTAGLALRSMPRAVPLVVLGLAIFLAGGVDVLGRALARRMPSVRYARFAPAMAFGVVVVLVCANMAPLFEGQFVDKNLERPENIPAYMKQTANYLDSQGDSTRVLQLPGADFSHYRWGATLDPVLPGIMNRPFVSRELIPYGEPASAELLRALDRRLQEGVFEESSLPALSQLMSVGDIELRSDLQYERFRTPRPNDTWQIFGEGSPSGLQPAKTFGPKVAEKPQVPMTDEITLAEKPSEANPPAVAVFGVNSAVPIVRAESAQTPLLVAGDGEGLVDAAAAGLLSQSGVVLYAASMTPAQIRNALGQDAALLVTDSNRKRAERWGTVRENYGYTETANQKPLTKDVTDARLPVFPDETTASQTIAEDRGVASVEASDYGNPVSYAPANQPSAALDGDPSTAWEVGAFSDVRGERIKVTLQAPVTTDHLTLTQPLVGPRNRWITKAQISLDGRAPIDVSLGDVSRTPAGQVVRFPRQSFTTVQITIRDTNTGVQASYNGGSAVGFAEIGIPGVHLDEVLRLPTDLLTAAGSASLQHPLVVQLTRDRANPAEPFKSDTETYMARDLQLPTARTFSLTGTARLSAAASDELLDRSVGRTGGVTATSSARLPGDVTARAAAAFDGNPSTIWMPPIETPQSWIQVSSPTAVTTSSLDLSVVADGRHSVPTKLRLDVDGKPSRVLTLPAISDRPGMNSTVPVHLTFPSVTGHTFRIEMQGLRSEYTRDYFSQGPDLLPVGIADVNLAGLRVPTEPKTLPSACRSDLVTVDGKPVPVRISGTTAAAESRRGLTVSLCGAPLSLGSGSHVIRTAKGELTGFDIDRLELSSAAGGGAAVSGPAALSAAPASSSTLTAASVNDSSGPARTAGTPKVTVLKSGETSYKLRVSGANKPFWLVLGQSLSDGWSAKVAGGSSLGTPRLIDGYANGWYVRPTSSAFDVSLDWTPQNTVWKALGISAIALIGCLVIAMWPAARRWMPGTAVAASTPTATHPLIADRGRFDLVRAIVAVALLTAGTALVIRPVVAPIVAVLSLVGLLLPRGRALLRLGSAACLAASGLYVLQAQARYNLPSNGQWVAAFHKVATLSWLAVALLVADVVLGWARRSEPLAPAGGSGADPATDGADGLTEPGPAGAGGRATAPESPAPQAISGGAADSTDGRPAFGSVRTRELNWNPPTTSVDPPASEEPQ